MIAQNEYEIYGVRQIWFGSVNCIKQAGSLLSPKGIALHNEAKCMYKDIVRILENCLNISLTRISGAYGAQCSPFGNTAMAPRYGTVTK